MAAIPPLSGSTPQVSGARPADSARIAAQRAFFQAALGHAPSPRPVAPAIQTAATPTRPITRLHLEPDQPAPTRVLRPGSLVDIKV